MSEETLNEIEIDKDSESRNDTPERTNINTTHENDDYTSSHRTNAKGSSGRNSQDENVSLLQSHSATAPNGTLVQCHKHYGSTEQIDILNQEETEIGTPTGGSVMSKEDCSSSCITWIKCAMCVFSSEPKQCLNIQL